MHGLLHVLVLACGAALSSACSAAPAQPIFSRIVLPGHLLLLASPKGGNVLVIPSDKGILLVDSGEPDTAPQLYAEIKSLGQGSIRVIVVSHYHWDHSGGVNLLGGGKARLYATQATGEAWARPDQDRPDAADGLVPSDIVGRKAALTWGSETLELEPMAPAHTRGDLIVWIRSQNAVFLGDLFQFDGYPSVGLPDGGSHKGTIRALRAIIANSDETTLVIPGHGYPASRADLIAWTDMLEQVTLRIQATIDAGGTLEEIIASRPTREFDARWGRGYLKPDDFVKKIFRDLTGYYRKPGEAGP